MNRVGKSELWARLASVAVFAVVLAAGFRLSPVGDVQAQSTSAAPPVLRQLEDSFTAVAEKVQPAVVTITAEKRRTVQNENAPDIFDFGPFGRLPRAQNQPRTVGGSGVIVRPNGYILTNDHVVGGMENVQVELPDGRTFSGKVLRDYATDLALVKIEATGLPTARLADSSTIKPGAWAIAIGSPFGLEHTLTVGVVSATEREASIPDGEGGGRYYASLVQTDASINPGNSGGPLLNISGEIIGINVAIESPTGANAGIGYAIPANTAQFVLDQLISTGKVTRGYLGLVPADLKPADAERYGIKSGALVSRLEDDTPAAKAGLQVEDVIVQFNGKPVLRALDLRDVAARTTPGTSVPVVVVRLDANGKAQRKSVNVTLGTFPDQLAEAGSNQQTGSLGLTVGALTDELREQHNLPSGAAGVVVTEVTQGSVAARAGLEVGDLIQRINGRPVTTVAQYRTALGKVAAGDTISVIVRRADSTMRLDIRMPGAR